MLIIPEPEVLAIIGRADSTTLWDWSRRKGWFPSANIPGRPPRWTEKTIVRWINEDVPKLHEAGARIPELKTEESTLAYQAACLGRLQYMKEKWARQAAIVKVLRHAPQSA